MEYVIEDKPLGPKRGGPGRALIYPYDKMDIGQSFVVPKAIGSKAFRSAFSYGRRHNMKFGFRVEGDFVRIGRTA